MKRLSKSQTIILLLLLALTVSAQQTTDNYPPGLDSQPQAGVPKGEIIKLTFDSKSFGHTREYSIYVSAVQT